MTEAEVYERMVPVFRDVFDDDALVPVPEMSADDVEEWDSLSHIRLVVSLEQEFGVRFSTVELSTLETVGDLARLIVVKQSS